MAAEETFTLTEIETVLEVSGIREKDEIMSALGRLAARKQELGQVEYPAIYSHIDRVLRDYAEYEADGYDSESLYWEYLKDLERLSKLEDSEKDEYTIAAATAITAYALRTVSWWDFEGWEGEDGIEATAVKAGADMQNIWQGAETNLGEHYPNGTHTEDALYKYQEALRDDFFKPFFEELKARQPNS